MTSNSVTAVDDAASSSIYFDVKIFRMVGKMSVKMTKKRRLISGLIVSDVAIKKDAMNSMVF